MSDGSQPGSGGLRAARRPAAVRGAAAAAGGAQAAGSDVSVRPAARPGAHPPDPQRRYRGSSFHLEFRRLPPNCHIILQRRYFNDAV